MNSNDLSRRGFLSTAVGVGATGGISAAASPHQTPERAWIIMEQRWHYNDEFYLADGGCAHLTLYYSKDEAAAECRRLCEEFFATESPEDFRDELESYLDPDSYDPSKVTWDQLLDAGYEGPYRILELQIPTRKTPP